VCEQASRIVSLDRDGTGYDSLGERDGVVGEFQRKSGWLRPVLFHSPYEAACWGVISARARRSLSSVGKPGRLPKAKVCQPRSLWLISGRRAVV